MIKSSLLWWGYIHTNGTLHVKRYFNDKDLDDARYSHFVIKIFMPFEAKDNEEALSIVRMKHGY